MPPIDEPAPARQPREGRRSKGAASGAEPRAVRAELVAVTLDAANGQVVGIERVDDAGVHRKLSDEDRTRLAEASVAGDLKSLVEQAFEAGIDSVLAAPGEAEPEESDDEAELSRLLLRSLIARSPAGLLLQDEVLQQAIVRTLIERAATGRGGPPEGAVAH